MGIGSDGPESDDLGLYWLEYQFPDHKLLSISVTYKKNGKFGNRHLGLHKVHQLQSLPYEPHMYLTSMACCV